MEWGLAVLCTGLNGLGLGSLLVNTFGYVTK